MLPIYTKLEDVPEALREHYKLIEGRYVPEISDDHPIKVNNAKLLTEKSTAEANLTNAQTELAGAKADLASARTSSGLPRGHRAVPVADVELLDQIKTYGTAAEVTAKLTEHKTLKEESDGRKTQDHLRKVAKVLGYDNVEAFVLLSGLPDFEIVTKDGKETVVAKVKDGANIVEKSQADVDSLPSIAPFLSALKMKSGTYVPEQRRDPGKPVGNQYDKIRDDAKKRAEKKDTSIPLGQRQGLRVIGSERAA